MQKTHFDQINGLFLYRWRPQVAATTIYQWRIKNVLLTAALVLSVGQAALSLPRYSTKDSAQNQYAQNQYTRTEKGKVLHIFTKML